MSTADSADFEYDVALSFAGEDREYVEEVAASLNKHGIKVFYDRYEQAKLWGKDLYQHLADVYRKRSRYCVMFLSHHYAAKLWTTHERRAAQARAFEENQEYILPVRVDDTEVAGILPTIGYVSAKDFTPLRRSPRTPPALTKNDPPALTKNDPDEEQHLFRSKPGSGPLHRRREVSNSGSFDKRHPHRRR